MTSYPGWEKLLNWLLEHSLQAGALVLLVLCVQWIFRRQLTKRWRFALWWIVLVRLLLPFTPESAVSLFNYQHLKVPLEETKNVATMQSAALPSEIAQNSQRLEPAISKPSPSTASTIIPPANTAQMSPDHSITFNALPTSQANHQTASRPPANFADLVIPAAAALWLIGIITLSVCAMFQTIRFRRKLKRSSSRAGDALTNLLTGARQEAGVSRQIELLETDAVNSPALFGFWRLKLLLPRGLENQFTARELRYIFLHELAHVRRHDLWLNWLVTALQILHWFNPLVWFGFARLRADRELACDELALIFAGDHAGTSYGETVIKLLENLNRPKAIPGLMGILEDKSQMRQRISMIAKFRQPGRWSALAILLLAGVAAVSLTNAQSSKPVEPRIKIENALHRPDLTGKVLAKDGEPLPVSATVFIATAGPKVGTSPFCPSCYADCQKSAKTDAGGNFEIKSLDPQLRFQILAVAKGYKPKYVNHVDPAKGSITVKLEPIELASAPPGNCLHGQVVDAKGKPVVGAVVEAHGIRTRGGSGRFGSLPGVDPLAVTDENGDFLITSQKPFDMMDVRVSARGFANNTFTELASGKTIHKLTMTEGASVRGRVLFHGQPLTNVSVGVVSVDRGTEHFIGNFNVGTDSDGRFLFVNLPPNTDYYIYGSMDSLRSFGAIPIQKVHAGNDGELTDVGNLIVGPAHRLTGRVVLADGAAIPPKTRLLISSERAWDSSQISLPPDGRFEIAGVPSGTITVGIRLKGYRFSARNASLDLMNPFRLVGRVDNDITNLTFLLEKGPRRSMDFDLNSTPQSEWPQNQPLRGAESGVDHSHEITVTGKVTDEQTGEPLPNFRVIPGSVNLTWKRNQWAIQKSVTGTNGHYTVYLDKKWAQPILKIEAEGYLPASILLRPLDQTNANLALQTGTGPSGVVLTPDGKPVAGAEVLLMCADSDQPGFDFEGHLTSWRHKELLTNTDSKGRFTLAPQLGMISVAVASSNGFANVPMETLTTNSTLILQPYGKIEGTLNRPNGPGTNEDLDLSFAQDGSSMYQQIRLANHAVTDANGHFEFNRVPAGDLQISYRLKMPDQNSWESIPLQKITLHPGLTLTLNIKAPLRKSPESFGMGQRPPAPTRVPGATITGTVLLPDGKPAAGAQVAVQVTGKYLALGKAAFKSYAAWQDGSIVRTGPDGTFTLPMYKEAKSVIALNDDGYAQVSLENLNRSPQIQLQPWGRIEGIVRQGQHLATNMAVVLDRPPMIPDMIQTRTPGGTNQLVLTNSAPEQLEQPLYDFTDFRAQTDDQGKFAITYVPAGEQTISIIVPMEGGIQTHQRLATVTVKPGETVHVQLGGGERTVTGRLAYPEGETPKDLGHAIVSIQSGRFFELFEKIYQAKTQQERIAILRSPEYRQSLMSQRNYSAELKEDHTFDLKNVAPGHYELGIQFMDQNNTIHFTADTIIFKSQKEIVVPQAANTNDDSAVDLGTVQLEKLTLPTFPAPPTKK